MKKSKLLSLLVCFLLIPLTIFLGSQIPGRSYYLTSTVVILEIMVPFFVGFEGRKPQARELVVIAVLSALAVAARVAIPIPTFKAIFAVVMLSGISLGPEAGFLVGAVGALGSNFFFGQGPYTPWQMMAYGAAGLAAGFAYEKGIFKRRPLQMAVFGFVCVLCFVGPLLDVCSIFLMAGDISTEYIITIFASGFSVNLSQSIATFLVMVIFGEPLLEKLDRIKQKFAIGEDEDGI